MNTAAYDDMIAKAIQLVLNIGTLGMSILGTHRFFDDSTIAIQTFLANGLDLLITYSDGSIALEVWRGVVIVHKGDHSSLYEHLNHVFLCWHRS